MPELRTLDVQESAFCTSEGPFSIRASLRLRTCMFWSISYPGKCMRLATLRSRERGVLHMSPTIQVQPGWILKPELQTIPLNHSAAQSRGPGGFNVDMEG